MISLAVPGRASWTKQAAPTTRGGTPRIGLRRRYGAVAIMLCVVARPAAAQLYQSSYTASLLDQYLAPNPVTGQDQPDVTVLSRTRPEYDYRSVRLGNVVIRPEVSAQAGYDGNVTGTPSPHGSAELQTTASLAADADWSTGRAGTTLSVDDYRYPSQRRQSYTNYAAGVAGSRNFGQDTLELSFSHQATHETSRDLGVPVLDSPIAERLEDARIGYRVSLGRLFVQPALRLAYFDYDNGRSGGVVYQQTYRDHVLLLPGVSIGYELAPRRTLVLAITDGAAFDTRRVAGILTQSYNDFAVLFGTDYDVDGIIRFRLFGGYEQRSFTSAAYATVQAPVAEASMIWTPTSLTTVTGSVSRRINDAASESNVATTETGVQLRIDHEYLRNLILQLRAGYFLDQYAQHQGRQPLREAGAGLTWLLNRSMRLTASYDFISRGANSSGTSVDPNFSLGGRYTDNRGMLRLRIGL